VERIAHLTSLFKDGLIRKRVVCFRYLAFVLLLHPEYGGIKPMFCDRIIRPHPRVNRPIGLGIACVLLAILFAGCAATPMIGGPLEQRKLKAGTYEGVYMGGPNKVVVMVTIEDNRIVHIEMVEHWELMGKKAESLTLKRIIEHQSTRVDAVSGATNSSLVIMNAVQRAVEKAYPDQEAVQE